MTDGIVYVMVDAGGDSKINMVGSSQYMAFEIIPDVHCRFVVFVDDEIQWLFERHSNPEVFSPLGKRKAAFRVVLGKVRSAFISSANASHQSVSHTHSG